MSLKGSLETVGLADVLTLLATTGKTGELQVTGTTDEGRVWVKDGRLIASEAGRGPAHLDAVFDLLRVGTGSFSFEDGSAPSQPGEGADIGPLLAEAADRLSQWGDIAAAIPSLDCVVGMASEAPDDEVIIRADQWRLLASTGGGRSVVDVLTDMQLGDFDGCKALQELAAGRLITVASAVVAAEPALDEGAAPVDEFTAPVDEFTPPVEDAAAPVDEDYRFETLLPVVTAVSSSDDLAGVELTPVGRGGEVDLVVVGTPGSTYTNDDSDVYEMQHQAHDQAVDESRQWNLEAVSDPAPTAPAWYPEPDATEMVGDVDASVPPGDAADDEQWPPNHRARRDVLAAARGDWIGNTPNEPSPEPGAYPPIDQTAAVTTPEGDPSETVTASGTDAADPAEPAAEAEEPINRGLLLKFLSSVRS